MYIYGPRVPLSLKILGGGATPGTPFLESTPGSPLVYPKSIDLKIKLP